MGFLISARWHLYIEPGPKFHTDRKRYVIIWPWFTDEQIQIREELTYKSPHNIGVCLIWLIYICTCHYGCYICAGSKQAQSHQQQTCWFDYDYIVVHSRYNIKQTRFKWGLEIVPHWFFLMFIESVGWIFFWQRMKEATAFVRSKKAPLPVRTGVCWGIIGVRKIGSFPAYKTRGILLFG